MRMRSALPAAVLLVGCSLRHHPVAPEPARGPARDTLFLLDESRSDSAGLATLQRGMVAMLADDAIYLRAGAPTVYGIDGIRALLVASPPSAGERVSWQPLGGGVSNDLRSAYTFGVTARVSDPRTPVRLERYVAFWKRAVGQPWRISAYAEVNGPDAGSPDLTRPQTAPPTLALHKPLAQATQRVREADSLFSDLADRMGSAYAFAEVIAPTGVLFGDPQLVVGPAGAREYYTERGGAQAFAWHPVFAAAAGSADLGFTVGDYSTTSRGPSGAAMQRFGKYLTVWRRQPDGKWKFVVSAGNGRPAPERAP